MELLAANGCRNVDKERLKKSFLLSYRTGIYLAYDKFLIDSTEISLD